MGINLSSKTDQLLHELNTIKGLSYPDVGYSYFANIKGDGSRPFRRSVYTIISAGGGVTYSPLNATSARKRCENIRAAIRDAKN